MLNGENEANLLVVVRTLAEMLRNYRQSIKPGQPPPTDLEKLALDFLIWIASVVKQYPEAVKANFSPPQTVIGMINFLFLHLSVLPFSIP